MRRFWVAAAMVCAVLGTGCEWTGTSDDEAWNDAYSWVSFSGSYRLTQAIDSTTTETTNTTTERVGTTVAATLAYAGQLSNTPVVAGTVTLTVSDVGTFQDNGTGGLTWMGTGTGSGSITYATGAWSIRLPTSPLAGKAITAYYQYSGAIITPGSAITMLTVNQSGNSITMTDNAGTTYTGRITSASVPGTGNVSGTISMPFTVSGGGATITGSFTGTWTVTSTGSGGGSVGGTTATAGTLSNRTINATYVRGGTQLNINAAGGSVTITP